MRSLGLVCTFALLVVPVKNRVAVKLSGPKRGAVRIARSHSQLPIWNMVDQALVRTTGDRVERV